MRLDRFFSVADFEGAAARRLPRCVYEFVRGGTEDEKSLRANTASFDDYAFVPRGLVNVKERSQAVTIWDREYASPFGIAPTGLASMVCHQADLLLAQQAHDHNVPFIISGSSSVPMERLQADGRDCWYQAYLPGNRPRIQAILERAERAGIKVLVITMDTAVAANRENNARMGFSVPFKMRPRIMLDGMMHPRWVYSVFLKTLVSSGVPRFANLYETVGTPITMEPPQGFRTDRDALSWEDVEWIRGKWPHKLVLKGVLHPEDARKTHAIGADAIIVSNHGGRQLDSVIAPLHALKNIVAAVPQDMPVMVDGGFRRGADILKALALGARLVFIGRPVLYGAAVAGGLGIARVLDIMRAEIDRNQALLGCPSLDDVAIGQLHFRGLPTA